MGKSIKYIDIKNLSDDIEFIQIIDKLYQGRGDDDVLNSCEYSLELNKLELNPELRERFWEWFKKVLPEL